MSADRDVDPVVGAWLREVPPHDEHVMDRVSTGIAGISQRRRAWLPSRPIRVSHGDTNHRAPGGRRSAMFNTLRIGVAAAAVLAVGGGLAITGVLAPDRGLQLVAESPSPSQGAPATIIRPPTEFTGTLDTCGRMVGTGRTTEVFGATQDGVPVVRKEGRGEAWDMTWEPTDPRLRGTWVHGSDWDEYPVDGAAEGTSPSITTGTTRIENEDGAWEGSRHSFWNGQEEIGDPVFTLTGEGAYEGLSVVLTMTLSMTECVNTVRGVVVEQLPPSTER
jgi:hypothetical protein